MLAWSDDFRFSQPRRKRNAMQAERYSCIVTLQRDWTDGSSKRC
ncbi:MAG: hypothetical protein QM784_32090 [Polyangiaceae bacterium]